jgi:hypothetical protein
MHTATDREPDAKAVQDGFRITLAVTNGRGITMWLTLNQREARDLSQELHDAALAAGKYERREG